MKLDTRSVEKPWGRDSLPQPFQTPQGQRIGEIWFEPTAGFNSILIKYIFTSEKLSVQVHPTDAQAIALGEGDRGKEECWLVIDAEPGATLGVGFHKSLSPDALRAAALDGSIEDLLVWHPVSPGDFFFIPAGTVHAIGAGVSLIEIQQNSDITYRLFDYGRPRELHLDKGVMVSEAKPHDARLHRRIPEHGTVELASGRYFAAHRIDGNPDPALAAAYSGPCLIVPLSGRLAIAGECVSPGECGYARSVADITFAPDGQAILVREN